MPKYLTQEPQSMRGRYKRKPPAEHLKIAKALQRHPLTWTLVRECQSIGAASRFAKLIKTGEGLAFQDGKYEARISKESHHDTNQRAVFARFMN